MSANWWPDTGADPSNLGALQSTGTTLSIHSSHYCKRSSKQNCQLSQLHSCLMWRRALTLISEGTCLKFNIWEAAIINQGWIFWGTKNTLLSTQTHDLVMYEKSQVTKLCTNHLKSLDKKPQFLRRWKIGGIDYSLKVFLYWDPTWVILLVPRSQKAIFQVIYQKNPCLFMTQNPWKFALS